MSVFSDHRFVSRFPILLFDRVAGAAGLKILALDMKWADVYDGMVVWIRGISPRDYSIPLGVAVLPGNKNDSVNSSLLGCCICSVICFRRLPLQAE